MTSAVEHRERWPLAAIFGVGALVGAGVGAWMARRAARRFDEEVAARIASIRRVRPFPVGAGRREALPTPIQNYLDRCGIGETSDRGWWCIDQRGEMRLSEDGAWLPFEAFEYLASDRPAFVWRASLPLVSKFSFEALDALDGRDGRLDARLLGVFPVARASGPKAVRGELIRYLAELVWCPTAILTNPALVWREIDARTVEVCAPGVDPVASVRWEFDRHGDPILMRSNTRPREGESASWRCYVDSWRWFDGVRMPTYGEVAWVFEDRDFTYWRGEVFSVSNG
jgi:hypothetical protein